MGETFSIPVAKAVVMLWAVVAGGAVWFLAVALDTKLNPFGDPNKMLQRTLPWAGLAGYGVHWFLSQLPNVVTRLPLGVVAILGTGVLAYNIKRVELRLYAGGELVVAVSTAIWAMHRSPDVIKLPEALGLFSAATLMLRALENWRKAEASKEAEQSRPEAAARL